ncbi:MAG: PEP-CTERM sorting domain-containing protein [Planctomycetota bacterium]
MDSRTFLAPALAAFVAAAYATGATAAIIDTMDDTAYFSDPFNGATVVDNANGTVTITKTAPGDSGIIWNNAGFKIDLANSEVTITPAVDNEDFINVTAQYFDGAGTFVNSALALADTNTDAPISFGIAAGAGIGAETYVLQIRILPANASSAVYTFDSIQAVPEPASLSLTLLGAGLLLRPSRRRLA